MNVFIYKEDYDFGDSLICEGRPYEEAVARDGQEFVLLHEAQSELAALREDLDECDGERHRLREELTNVDKTLFKKSLRLTAAEQRIADTIAKLELAASMMDDDDRGNRFAEVCRLAIKSLKPTESGASE